MITRFVLTSLTALILAPAISTFGAEHPEHPQAQTINKLQQTPAPANKPQEVTKGDISAGIKKHIAREMKKSPDKKFHVTYKAKDLALDLVKVHDDRLSNLGNGKYFACVDLKAGDGTVYDVDFFLTGNPGAMSVTETSVHKINGKPLYDWKEDNGVWKKVAKS